MDVLVLGAVVVVLTVVVYLLATLGTKETPYEEALAEQRQKQEQEQIALAKTDRQQKYKNTKQKKPKVRKDDFEQNGPASATKVEEVITEPDTTPPSTEPEASPQPQQEKKKKKKKDKEEDETPRKIVVEEVTETIVTKAEAVKVEAAKGKSSKPEAAKSSQAKAESPKADAVKVESSKGKTSKVEASKSEQAKAESPKAEVGKSKAAKAEAAKTETSKTEAAKAELAKGKAAKADVGKAEAAKITKAKETKTEAVKTEAAKTKAAPESTPPPQGKENKKEKVVTPVSRPKAEDNFEVVDGTLNSTGKATPTQEKKKKKEKQKTDIPGPKESRILPLVQDAHLSSGEIQTLIDILLNKQQQNNAGGEWVEKGRVDPTTQLRRQLEEVETRLREKDEAHSALSAKITALRTELNCERSRAVKLKAQLDDTVASHSRELENANANAQSSQNARLNEMKAALEKEYQTKMQQQQKILQQLQSTNNESEIATLRASLSESEMQTAVLRQEHEELTRRCQQYEEHIAALDEKRAGENASRNTQITELQAQLASADAQRAQALAEASAASAERDALNVQLANETSKTAQTQHKLQESAQEKTKVESRLAQIEGELCSVRQVVLDQTAEIERLKEEKESLASQSVRPAAEGQENGDVHAEQTQGPSTAHLESLVKEREIQIEQQISEVSNLKKEIARLKEELDNQKAKNNEASGEVEEEKTKVRAVLRRIFPEVVVDDALDQGAFLSEFETKALQVITQSSQTPQPEVVEKVVEKVVEVERVVEKVVEVKVEDPELKSQVEKLAKENAQLKSQVEDLKRSSSASDSKRVSELEQEVQAVNEKVVHYQTVLADTENLLKSLEASVESEEVTWNKRLSEKDQDLRQLTADKANLQLQVKQLEGTLDKVKQAEEMQSQLKELQEQLQKEEKEKAALQEELLKAQEQLTQTATKGSGDVDVGLLELRADNDKLRTLVSVGQDASRQQEQLIEELRTELASVKAALAASRVSKMGYMVGWVGRNSNNTTTNIINNNNPVEQQNASMNGPASEEQCQEDNTSRADTASLMSASSASVTDTNLSQDQSGATAKKAKKKRKGAGAKQ